MSLGPAVERQAWKRTGEGGRGAAGWNLELHSESCPLQEGCCPLGLRVGGDQGEHGAVVFTHSKSVIPFSILLQGENPWEPAVVNTSLAPAHLSSSQRQQPSGSVPSAGSGVWLAGIW
jgi:hypothetical protein